MFGCKLAGWLILLLALYFPYEYGRNQGFSDAKKIRRNGSKDNLKEKWHFDNAKRRGAILAICILVAYWLLFATLGFDLWVFAAYGLYAVAMFGYQFTTTLNCKRNLKRWYVSMDPRASVTDKFFRAGANKWNTFMGWLHKKTGRDFWPYCITPSGFSAFLHTGFVLLAFLLLVALVFVNYRNLL